MNRLQKVGVTVGVIYTTIGLLFGVVFGTIPAHTFAGQLYIAATWPVWIKGSPVDIGIPSWAFHFDPEDRPHD